MILHMFPRSSADYIRHGGAAYFVFGGELGAVPVPASANVSRADPQNVGLRKLRVGVILPSAMPKSAPESGVPGVVELGADVEMPWIHARRVVATVKDALGYGNLAAKRQLHRGAVCEDPFRRATNSTVAVGVDAAGPNPACRGFLYERPEPLLERRPHASVSHVVQLTQTRTNVTL